MTSFKYKRLSVSIIILLAVLLVFSSVYFTLAYKTDVTDELVNNFKEKEVEVEIKEKFDNAVKKDVYIPNTGDVPAYIRFKLAVSVTDEEGNIIALPIHTTTETGEYDRAVQLSDFDISNNDGPDWVSKFKEIDGMYYYPNLVQVGEKVAIFDEAKFNIPIFDMSKVELPIQSKDTYMSNAYKPVLSIIVESVQAEGVSDAWGVSYSKDENGNPTVIEKTTK